MGHACTIDCSVVFVHVPAQWGKRINTEVASDLTVRVVEERIILSAVSGFGQWIAYVSAFMGWIAFLFPQVIRVPVYFRFGKQLKNYQSFLIEGSAGDSSRSIEMPSHLKV